MHANPTILANPFMTATSSPTTQAADASQLAIWLMAVAQKDAGAFRALYDATASKLLGFGVRILVKREWAEEVVQESFISVWNNASSYQPGLSAPMTWMVNIVRNKAFDFLRRAQRDGVAVEIDTQVAEDGGIGPFIGSWEATPIEAMQMTDDAKALAHCLKQLHGWQLQALSLAFHHDLSHAEVAQQLQQPLGTIKTWIRRGLERLRLCLIKQEET